MVQAMKQIKPKEMTKPLKEKMVQPSIVLPTMQLVTQEAESELKCQKNEAPVFEPIRATPQFESSNSSPLTIKRSTRKCKPQSLSKRKKSHKKAKSSTQFRDIFN